MQRTAWHLTFGTYGTRLHGDARTTVDRENNVYGTPFLEHDPVRQQTSRSLMSATPVMFTLEQRVFIERTVPSLCDRGSWTFVTCAAGADHVHVLLYADQAVHGKQVRAWLKRWLTEALNGHWAACRRADGSSWFCEGGSARAVKTDGYFANVVEYIDKQRISLREMVEGGRMRVDKGTGATRPGSPAEGAGAE